MVNTKKKYSAKEAVRINQLIDDTREQIAMSLANSVDMEIYRVITKNPLPTEILNKYLEVYPYWYLIKRAVEGCSIIV